jgi:hypothetical protein
MKTLSLYKEHCPGLIYVQVSCTRVVEGSCWFDSGQWYEKNEQFCTDFKRGTYLYDKMHTKKIGGLCHNLC